MEVHGITSEFLAGKPIFSDVATEFIKFVEGAELVIHNAPFDVGFIDAELDRLEPAAGKLEGLCGVIDTLVMARHKHPGQRNNLDALCQRYEIDNSSRSLHGALLDAEILAEVYLAMTGGQATLSLSAEATGMAGQVGGAICLFADCRKIDRLCQLFGPQPKNLSAMKQTGRIGPKFRRRSVAPGVTQSR